MANSTDSVEGLDPADLLRQGAAEDTIMTENAMPLFEPPSLEELAVIFPRFEILEQIGMGGMGVVYKARQRDLDRVVALKILPPEISSDPAFAGQFSREAKALAKLSHPNIVAIHEFGQEQGLYYIVMEYVDGTNLRHLMKHGRLSSREALAIVPQICDALQYAHDQGIVHRDIKPENILLDRKGNVKVADFGLAKLVGVGSSNTSPAVAHETLVMKDGKVMGTPAYMAPEQFAHPTEVDHRADIYALGVVFYQMLTGELPGKPLMAPSRKVELNVKLDEVVLKALDKDPERRFQQASVMKTSMEEIGGVQGQARKKWPWWGKAIMWCVGIFVVFSFVMFCSIVYWFQGVSSGKTTELKESFAFHSSRASSKEAQWGPRSDAFLVAGRWDHLSGEKEIEKNVVDSVKKALPSGMELKSCWFADRAKIEKDMERPFGQRIQRWGQFVVTDEKYSDLPVMVEVIWTPQEIASFPPGMIKNITEQAGKKVLTRGSSASTINNKRENKIISYVAGNPESKDWYSYASIVEQLQKALTGTEDQYLLGNLKKMFEQDEKTTPQENFIKNRPSSVVLQSYRMVDDVGSFEKKFNGKVDRISSAVLMVDGSAILINIITAPDEENAKKVVASLDGGYGEKYPFVRRQGNMVVEYCNFADTQAGRDLAEKISRLLGLQDESTMKDDGLFPEITKENGKETDLLPSPAEERELDRALKAAEENVMIKRNQIEAGLAGVDELVRAEGEVYLLQAKKTGSPGEISKAKIFTAQKMLPLLEERFKAGVGSHDDVLAEQKKLAEARADWEAYVNKDKLPGVLAWLALIDKGEYDGSVYAKLAEATRSKMSDIARIRKPFGELLKRQYKGAELVFKANVYKLSFDVEFSDGTKAVETLGFQEFPGGSWHGVTYEIKK